jgi:hypothetical protein
MRAIGRRVAERTMTVPLLQPELRQAPRRRPHGVAVGFTESGTPTKLPQTI